MGNYIDAVKDFSNVIDLNPKHATAYFKRGMAKKETGDMQGCCIDLHTALDNGSLEAYHYIKLLCKK